MCWYYGGLRTSKGCVEGYMWILEVTGYVGMSLRKLCVPATLNPKPETLAWCTAQLACNGKSDIA